jgi:hypothetical protein
MYPSGLWNGYWEQPLWGRQPMHDFMLRFAGGVVEGEGHDVVGPFVVRGQYDDCGAVVFIKQYVGKHAVRYEGVHDGEGTIHGRWSIGEYWSGPFALRPVAPKADPDAPIYVIG